MKHFHICIYSWKKLTFTCSWRTRNASSGAEKRQRRLS